MNNNEAYQEMLKGHKMTNTRYPLGEYVFLNEEGEIETESGTCHGGLNDPFWAHYQNYPDGWSIFE